MGHVVNPVSIRLGYNKVWTSSWNTYDKKNNKYLLSADFLFTAYFNWFAQNKFLDQLGIIISHYRFFRQGNNIKIVLFFYDGKTNNLINELIQLFNSQGSEKDNNINDEHLLYLFWENFIWLKLQKKIWDVILNHFLKHLKLLYPQTKIEVHVQKLQPSSLPAPVLLKYIIKRLMQRYTIIEVMNPIIRDLKLNPDIIGFRVNCSGRFTRQQMASYLWWKEGSLSVNTLSIPVDYAATKVRLRYGICGIKVWLYFKNVLKDNTYIYKKS